jgi:hypothetical protein
MHENIHLPAKPQNFNTILIHTKSVKLHNVLKYKFINIKI